MFRKNKTINTIVNKKIENDNLVKDLRNQLKDGCKKSVIVFVDLCKSTDLKQDKDDIDWLCDIYSFINEVQTIGINNNGTIIKRIGDEIMLEFSNLIDSENFLTELDSNDLLNQFDYKIGCDYGDVYYFHYDNSVDDPYGTTVDRCARIIGLARGSVIFVSEYYRNELNEEKRNSYFHIGNFVLKGIKNTTGIYVRNEDHKTQDYFQPLIKKLNSTSISGFHYVSRKFEKEYFSEIHKYSGKPFLLRYLLNIPKQNISIDTLLNLKKDEYEIKEYIGYLYDGYGYFQTYGLFEDHNYMFVILSTEKETFGKTVTLDLPINYFEIIKKFKKNEKLYFEGILINLENSKLTFDYVEIKDSYVNNDENKVVKSKKRR